MTEQVTTSPNTDDILNGIRSFLKNHPEIVFGWAYGSLVDGRFRATSDVDIAFFAKQKIDLDTRLAWTAELGRDFGRRVDLVDLGQTKGLIVKEILTQGRLLKNDNPDILARFLSRYYLDEADYGRLRDRAYQFRREAVFGEPEQTNSRQVGAKV